MLRHMQACFCVGGRERALRTSKLVVGHFWNLKLNNRMKQTKEKKKDFKTSNARPVSDEA